MSDDYYRGNKTLCVFGGWYYADTLEIVSNLRGCGICKKPFTKEGHDPCLGTLPGVANACCGHGRDDEAYVQFLDMTRVGGEMAIIILNRLKREL